MRALSAIGARQGHSAIGGLVEGIRHPRSSSSHKPISHAWISPPSLAAPHRLGIIEEKPILYRDRARHWSIARVPRWRATRPLQGRSIGAIIVGVYGA